MYVDIVISNVFNLNKHFFFFFFFLSYPQSSNAQETFQLSPRSIPLIHSLYHILSHPPSAATCDPRYVKQSNCSSNCPPFSITCIRPPFPYLEHLITLLLPTFTLNFLLSHTLPNSLTSRHLHFYGTLISKLLCKR